MKKPTCRLPVLRMTMAEDGTRDLRRSHLARLLTLGIGIAMGCMLATGTALAGGGVAADDPGKRRFCTATTLAQYDACRYETRDDFSIAKAKCINVSDGDERAACFGTAREARAEARKLCRTQRA